MLGLRSINCAIQFMCLKSRSQPQRIQRHRAGAGASDALGEGGLDTEEAHLRAARIRALVKEMIEL
jgi:hypothetical protein